MENQTDTTPSNVPLPSSKPQDVARYMETLKLEQNFAMAIVAGVASAFVSAVLWAVITVATGYQIGYMAIGVGLLVGFSIRHFGKGIDQIFGITGALFALLGCVCGNFFSTIGSIAHSEGLDYLAVLQGMTFPLIQTLMVETFSPMDILFYGFAIYEGYKFSFRVVSEEEIKMKVV